VVGSDGTGGGSQSGSGSVPGAAAASGGDGGEQRLLAGRYELGARLGRGGMGTVWRARDTMLDRDVAVKELSVRHLAEEDLRIVKSRMQQEARAAARIKHPGVITIHDVLEQDGRPWIVMELVDGRSLAELVDQEGPLAPRDAAGIGVKVLDALTAGHRAGVLHRDVKPANVLLERGTGRVVLTDFGIATFEGDSALTRTGDLIGSPDYLPPERVHGGRPGPESDLWALGATLWAAVEGRSPFRRDSPVSTLAAVLSEPLPEPERAGVLAPVLRALLAKEPPQRPPAAQARAMLESIAAGHTMDIPGAALAEAQALAGPEQTGPEQAGPEQTGPQRTRQTGPEPLADPEPQEDPRQDADPRQDRAGAGTDVLRTPTAAVPVVDRSEAAGPWAVRPGTGASATGATPAEATTAYGSVPTRQEGVPPQRGYGYPGLPATSWPGGPGGPGAPGTGQPGGYPGPLPGTHPGAGYPPGPAAHPGAAPASGYPGGPVGPGVAHPGAAPAPAPAPVAGAKRKRAWPALVGVGVAVALIAAGATAYVLTRHQKVEADGRSTVSTSTSAGASPSPSGSGGASASASGSASPGTPTVPAGYRWQVDPEGFGFALPDASGQPVWHRLESNIGEIDYSPDPDYDPGRPVHVLRFGIVTGQTETPLEHAEEMEQDHVSKGLAGYRRQSMAANTFKGLPGALWTFTFDATGAGGQVSTRWAEEQLFREPDGTEYDIYIGYPGSDQTTAEQRFAEVLRSFTVLGG